MGPPCAKSLGDTVNQKSAATHKSRKARQGLFFMFRMFDTVRAQPVPTTPVHKLAVCAAIYR